MCTYLQPMSNNYIEKGVSQKVNRRWISNRRCGCVKKGWVKKSTKDEYPIGGARAMSKKGRIRNVNWDLTRKTWISIKSTSYCVAMHFFDMAWHLLLDIHLFLTFWPTPLRHGGWILTFYWLSDPSLFDTAHLLLDIHLLLTLTVTHPFFNIVVAYRLEIGTHLNVKPMALGIWYNK